jgi:hypothetical protein
MLSMLKMAIICLPHYIVLYLISVLKGWLSNGSGIQMSTSYNKPVFVIREADGPFLKF